jgi:uncharacterized phiE125 gp8 family phage protein
MLGFNAIGMDGIGMSGASSSTSVSSDLTVLYVVRSAVSADLAAQYAVRAQVSSDLSTSYSVCAQVYADLVASYSVQALVMSSVSASLSAAYTVYSSVSSDLSITFAVEPPVEYVRAPLGTACRHGPAVYPDSLKRVGLVQSAVSVDAARRAARADGDELDEEIVTAAEAYTEAAEHTTGRAFVMQAWRAGFRAFAGEMILPKPPLMSITHVSYYDETGAQRTIDPRDYFVDVDAEPAVLTPAPGRAWPMVLDRANAVEVQYTAGYGPTEASVPKPVKQYVLARIQQQFSPVATAKDANFDRLLDPYLVFL